MAGVSEKTTQKAAQLTQASHLRMTPRDPGGRECEDSRDQGPTFCGTRFTSDQQMYEICGGTTRTTLAIIAKAGQGAGAR